MFNSITSRLHGQTHPVQQQPPALHSQDKAPKLNQIQDRAPQVRLANSLVKAGSKLTGLFRGKQRDVGKNEQRAWHDPLMRVPQNDSAAGLQMGNSSAAHAITQKLNAEGSYTDIRALQAHATGTGVQGYVLRDQDNNHHQLQQSDALISSLKSSMPSLQPPKPAGRGHQAESSGIYADNRNRQFTLHGRTLYQFDRSAQRWARAQPPQNDISRLSLDHTGELILYHHKDDVRDHSTNETHVAQLMRNGKVRLAEHSEPGNVFETQLHTASGEPMEVQRVGLLPRTFGPATLVAIDKAGKLHQARLPLMLTAKDALAMKPVTLDFSQAVGTDAADKAELQGFIHDSDQLKAVIRDGMGLRHSTTLDVPENKSAAPDHATLTPGWRLSEQLHLVNNSGLPERIGDDDTQVRLHGGAALGLSKNGDLCGWNETTQHWDKLHVHGVSQLLRGLDDKPYIIQDGKPKAVDASFAQPKLKLGNEDEVALGRSTAATLGRTLSEEPISQCAVLDDKHFALLTPATGSAGASLKASLDGLSVAIPAPRDANGQPVAITSVALDQAKHLYATAGGNLYRLPHDQWTQSHHGDTAAWKPAGFEAQARGASAPPGPLGDAGPSSAANAAPPTLGADVLKDKVKAALAQLPGAPLSDADAPGTRVEIGKVEIGPNKRPIIEATLHRPPSANGAGAAGSSAGAAPQVSSHSLELSYDRQGAVVLRPAKVQASPTANTQWEKMQANNHTTAKIGNANGAATTTMFGSTNDNVRTGGAKNIFKSAAEGLRKMGDSYQHHLHPIDAPKASASELKQAYKSGDKLKDKLQAAGNHALTPGARSRAGLNPIYQESQRLYDRFKTTSKVPLQPALGTRIDNLPRDAANPSRTDQEHTQLHKGLKALRDSAEDSSYQAIVRLGQTHGLLDGRGMPLKAPVPGARASGPVNVLSHALRSSGLDANSKARTKLDELVSLGLTLPERRTEPGLDNTGRNKSPTSLLEDRLLLDVQTLHQVGDLLSRVEGSGMVTSHRADKGKPGASTTLDQLQALRLTYENSDIKLFSDNGIVSHGELEKLHAARDTVARELTGKHGLNYNTTRSFNDDLHAIGDHFGNLQAGDATSLLRSKGATLTTPAMFIPLTPDGGGLYLNFGAGREHGVSLETEGGDSGTTLGLKNSHSTNQFLNVGYYHAPSAVVDQLFSSSPSGNPSSASQLYSADASFKATQTHAIAGWLTANNASMANIMENLLDPSASLADLYRLGQDQGGSVETSKVSQQTLGTSVSVDLGRLNLGGRLLSNDEGGAWNAFMRATAGISADTTLLSNAKTQVSTHKGEGQDAIANKNAFGVLPAASVGAYARIGAATSGNAWMDPHANGMGVKNNISLGQTALPDALSVNFALDRAKNDKFTLAFKPGKAVTTPQLQDVEKALGKVLKEDTIHQAVSDRQGLLDALKNCAPAPVNTPATLTANPLGGFTPPAAPARQRPADARLADLRALLPRLQAGLPKQAAEVAALQAAVANLPAAPSAAERDAVLTQAHTLAGDMQTHTLPTDTKALLETATKAIEAGHPVADLDGHLAALQGAVSQLDHLPRETEGLHELRYSVAQLAKHNTLAKTGGRLLASGEHKYTSTGLQLSKGGLIGGSAAWRSKTSTQNADAIATFINKHPVLQEMARRAEREGPTSMELTLELKPKVLERIEASLNTQDPDIQKKLEEALRDDNNIRVKRFTLLRSATQTDAKATPNVVVSAKSSASVTDSVVLASMDLKYSHEHEHQPVSVTPGGLLVQPHIAKAVRDDLGQQNITLRGSRNRKDLHSASEEDAAQNHTSGTAVEHSSNSANTGTGPQGTSAL